MIIFLLFESRLSGFKIDRFFLVQYGTRFSWYTV